MKLASASFLRPMRADFSFLPTGGAVAPAQITASDIQAPAVTASFGTPYRLAASYELGTFRLPISPTDTVSFSDGAFRALEKPASDLVALTDTVAYFLTANRASSDLFALADSPALSPSKVLTEGFSASDAATFQWDWTRPFASSAVFGDVASRTVSRPVYDTAKFSESVAYDLVLGRSVSDTVSLPTAGEAVYKVFTSKHTEAAAFVDAGSLRSQSYADTTYFAGDYVGASRDF